MTAILSRPQCVKETMFERGREVSSHRFLCHWRVHLLCAASLSHSCINTLRPRQNGRPFADEIFKCIFLNENVWIPIKISLKFVPQGPIDNIPALVQIMAWRRPGDKPLSEPMMVRQMTHICVTRPQWVKAQWKSHTDLNNACVLSHQSNFSKRKCIGDYKDSPKST